MELVAVNNRVINPEIKEQSRFITANTEIMHYELLKKKCIIPVFAKDNESTISHAEFIDLLMESISTQFGNERICSPVIAVSHPIKGRIPEAIGKPVEELLEHEKTIYYERMAFTVEIPSITETINGNPLSLSVGGVRAYNLDNLRGRKSLEKFKLFIGFQNKVCTNLCVSTDGFLSDVRVMNLHDLFEKASEMISGYNMQKQLDSLKGLPEYGLSESQFAHMIGKAKLYQFLPVKEKKNIPAIPFSDSQISTIAREYYSSKSFCRNASGEIDLWKLYNLFTGANKSSYIDNFLDRGVQCTDFVSMIRSVLESKSSNWYLNRNGTDL
jgi:hypothetical protein